MTEKIFKFLSLYGNYEIIGSSNKKYNIKYIGDYDLQEYINLTEPEDYYFILNLFRKKFAKIEEDDNIFYTDFKSGLLSSMPIRWNYQDIMNGYKQIDTKKIFFIDTLNNINGNVVKLDIIVKSKSEYMEYTCNYYFNFVPKDINIITTNLLLDVKKYYSDKNYMKMMKRLFSYIIAVNNGIFSEEAKKLVELFNSNIGKLYYTKSRIQTIKLLFETNTKFNLEHIKNYLNKFDVSGDTIKQLIKAIDKKSNQLQKDINKSVIKWINNN